jgi:hypothetical protein
VTTLPKTCATIYVAIAICSVLSIYFSAVPTTIGQTLDRATRARSARQGAKPGEVITAPDLSEQWRDPLQVGRSAPEFTLPLAQSSEEAKAIAQRQKQAAGSKGNAAKTNVTPKTISLKDIRAKKPVVLIFGSVTCPPFRRALDGIDDVAHDFHDQAEFLFVYIREAHPDSVLSLVGDKQTATLTKVPQATTTKERTEAAVACGLTLNLDMPIAVDAIDNKVGRAYAGWPNRMVVVGTDGKILFASTPSPRGTDAALLRDWLKVNVRE